jgi:tRNA (cytidine56-2'-O)-methyltransferase
MKKSQKIVVLRWGHRSNRDKRLTTHVILTARAFGASGLILSDVIDEKIQDTIMKVIKIWGGSFFFKMGVPYDDVVKKWRKKGGIVVHLTAYGENIHTSNVLCRVKKAGEKILVIVGGKKVPRDFFSEKVSDFNIAIGNQPHSECSSLAVFLDRLFKGEGLTKEFKRAKVKIIPQERGKKVIGNYN